MSCVTTVVIISDGYSKEEDCRIAILNKYLIDNYHKNKFEVIDSSLSGGTKYPERRLYQAGLNYLCQDEFLELFRSLKWGNSLLIMGHDNSDNGYVVVPSQGEFGNCIVKVQTKYEY